MRDPKRIGPMLHQIGRLWREYPDLRLGQLMMNLAHTGPSRDLFNLEDDELAIRVDIAMNEWAFMRENGPEPKSRPNGGE